MKSLVIYAGSEENAKVIESNKGDIAGTLKVTDMKILAEKCSEGRQVGSSEVFVKVEY
jgi:hypothetical protein